MTILDPHIERELNKSGIPWCIKPGRKHEKLIVAGRLVGVVPRSRKGQGPGKHGGQNLLSAVRRAIRSALEVAA